MKTKLYTNIISFILVLTTLFSLVACSSTPSGSQSPSTPDLTPPTLSDPNEGISKEDILNEDVLTEEILTEFITTEIYLKEIIEAEEKITELLLAEDMINEVTLCKTIYVPQDHIEEFSENSQTAELFGAGIDFGALATKIAVGTGIIVTLVVLKKVGLPEPVASVVVGAASGSMKFAASGAAIGSLYGALTGATDEIDETGRTSAIIGVAAATAGLILSTVSLVAAIPSGGASSIGVAAGIKIGIAAVSVAAATAGTAVAAVNAVKTFKATDATDVDWDNIDWDRVGVSAAQQAINNAADGYMWGSIAGAVYGGANGYEFYEKYNTPYSKYNARLVRTPVDGERGHWTGARGESDYVLKDPIELPNGTKITKITYKNAVPDFSPHQLAKVKIIGMSDKRYGTDSNFNKADEALAKQWTQSKHNGQQTWTARDVANYREANHLTWHEMNNMEYMQLVPTEVNATFGHLGGVGEYNAMIGQTGGSDFD